MRAAPMLRHHSALQATRHRRRCPRAGTRKNMDPTPQEQQQHEPALPRVSRRARIIGSIVAILIVAGLGWLAWDLTHPSGGASDAASGARAGGGGAGRAGGGGGGGRGGPPTTVGVAAAERVDLPVT